MAFNTPMRVNTTPLTKSSFKSKQVFLHEWWLVKPQNHFKGFAIAGFASMPRGGESMFVSTLIVKRHGANILETEDGIIVMFRGMINSSRTSQNGFSSEVCRCFLVGFPHDWKKNYAHSSGNECDYGNRVTDFDVSNTSSHKETTDGTSQEPMEAEGNKNITKFGLSHPQVEETYNGENEFSNVDDSNASCHKMTADATSHETKEAEDDNNVGSLRMSQLQVDVVNNGENEVSSVDVTSHETKEAEDADNVGSLRMSQLQVDVINSGENGVSSVAAVESSQSRMSVFEFDPVLEQSSVRSPLHPKKLKFNRKEKKRLKQKIVEDPGNLCRRVTRSIAKNSHIML